MMIFAILTVKAGNFKDGFNVSFAIKQGEILLQPEIEGFLPSNPKIYSLTSIQKNGIKIDTNVGIYQDWYDWYIGNLYFSTRQLRNHSGITILPSKKKSKPTIKPADKCFELAKKLKEEMCNWLKSNDEKWIPICIQLATALEKYFNQLQLVISIRNIDCDDVTKQLWKLPWHEWNILDNYEVDVGLNITPSAPLPRQLKREKHSQIRILHILGDDQNIDLKKDYEIIKKVVKNAEIIPLIKPSHRKLVEILQQDKKGFDILIFSGHSKDDLGVGKFLISEGENAAVDDLKHSFQEAIKYGLKLVIFNSCVSLSIAKDLLNYGFSAVISMREEIPDEVAHIFLENFLKNYVDDKSIYTALKKTRIALEALEKEFGGATWLPVICQNLAITPPSFLKLQTPLNPDSRLLIIRVTPEDKAWLNQPLDTIGGGARTLSDASINKLIEKLQNFQPLVIGLDIFREGSIDNEAINFKSGVADGSIITVCTNALPDNLNGISAPENALPENVGFADFVVDEDNIIRRQLLFMSLKNPRVCHSTDTRQAESFSLKLAQRYLQTKGITRQDRENDNFIQLGNVTFPPLSNHQDGYPLAKNIEGGIQVMLNYRPLSNYLTDIAPTFTLRDVFEDTLILNDVKDKIVLIGVDKQIGDRHLTFFNQEKTIPGVFIHALMVRNILDIVEEKISKN